MVRRVRNPGSGKPPHNGPAKGPGWGGPARGGPPTGPGYGGPANPGDRPPKAFTREWARELAAKLHGPDKAIREAACDEMRRITDERIIWAVVGDEADPLLGVRVNAAETARSRIDGKAIQHVTADSRVVVSDDQLKSRLLDLLGKAGGAGDLARIAAPEIKTDD